MVSFYFLFPFFLFFFFLFLFSLFFFFFVETIFFLINFFFKKIIGLLLYTWGSANNVLKNKLIQLQLGVDAVIADNITILKKENEVIN